MRRAVAVLTLVFAVALTAATVSAQRRGGDPSARKNPVPANAASITAGRALYNKNCRHCHGLRGKGDGALAPKDPKPADLTDDKWDLGSEDGEIFLTIWNGGPARRGKESEMKGMKGTLAEKEVWQLITYLRSIGPAAGAKAAAK